MSNNVSCICQAIAHGNEEMARFLLSAGAKVDQKDMFGNTALDEARKRGLQKIVKLLLSPPNVDTSIGNQTCPSGTG